MKRPIKPIWADDKYKTNADAFGYQDEIDDRCNDAGFNMDALETRCAELTRKNKNRRRNAHANRKLIGTLKGRVAEQDETITELKREIAELKCRSANMVGECHG